MIRKNTLFIWLWSQKLMNLTSSSVVVAVVVVGGGASDAGDGAGDGAGVGSGSGSGSVSGSVSNAVVTDFCCCCYYDRHCVPTCSTTKFLFLQKC